MTTAIKRSFETQIFLNDDDVTILQIGSGFDVSDGCATDKQISFPLVHLDAVIQALRALEE